MTTAESDSTYAELSVALRLPGRRRDAAPLSPFTALTGYRDRTGPVLAGPSTLALVWHDPKVGWRPAGAAVPPPDTRRAPASATLAHAVPAPAATTLLQVDAAAPSAIGTPAPTHAPAPPSNPPPASRTPTPALAPAPVLVARLAALAADTHQPDNRVRPSSEAVAQSAGGPERLMPRTSDSISVTPQTSPAVPAPPRPVASPPAPSPAAPAPPPASVITPGKTVLTGRLTALAGRTGMAGGTGDATPAHHRDLPTKSRQVVTRTPSAGPAEATTIGPQRLEALPQPAHVTPYPVAAAAATSREPPTCSTQGTRTPSGDQRHEPHDGLTDSTVRLLSERLAELAREEQFRTGRR